MSKSTHRTANNVDPDQTASIKQDLSPDRIAHWKSRFDLVVQRQIFRPITETKSWSWELMLLIKILNKYLWSSESMNWIHQTVKKKWAPITKTSLFKYIEKFTIKKGKFSDKKIWYFSYFCSKHRLWVLVRTASPKAVLTSTHNLCFWAEIRKIMYTPVNPSFTT